MRIGKYWKEEAVLQSAGDRIDKILSGEYDEKIDDKTPPAFIFAAVDDGCVPVGNSLNMAKALNEKNIPFEMHIYSKGNHGFSTGDYVTCNDRFDSKVSDWLPKCKEWLYELFFAKTIDK